MVAKLSALQPKIIIVIVSAITWHCFAIHNCWLLNNDYGFYSSR